MRLDQPWDDVFASGTHVKVLRAIYALPAGVGVSGRDLARRAGVSHPRATRVLAELSEHGLVTIRRLPRTDLHSLNRSHALATALVQLFEREPQLKVEVLSMIAGELKKRHLPVTQARIFGSAARGSMTSSSDVDLALVARRESVPAVEAAAQEIAEIVRQRFGTRLNVVVASASLNTLTKKGRPGRNLWEAVRREGIDLLAEPAAAH